MQSIKSFAETKLLGQFNTQLTCLSQKYTELALCSVVCDA